MMFRAVILVLCLLLPTLTWAADGDVIMDSASIMGRDTVDIIYLCHNKIDGNSTCAEFDVWNFIRTNPRSKYPTSFAFMVEAEAGGTPTVTIRGFNISGGASSTITTLPTATTPAADWVEVLFSPPRYIDATLANMTNVTDLDVSLRLHYN